MSIEKKSGDETPTFRAKIVSAFNGLLGKGVDSTSRELHETLDHNNVTPSKKHEELIEYYKRFRCEDNVANKLAQIEIAGPNAGNITYADLMLRKKVTAHNDKYNDADGARRQAFIAALSSEQVVQLFKEWLWSQNVARELGIQAWNFSCNMIDSIIRHKFEVLPPSLIQQYIDLLIAYEKENRRSAEGIYLDEIIRYTIQKGLSLSCIRQYLAVINNHNYSDEHIGRIVNSKLSIEQKTDEITYIISQYHNKEASMIGLFDKLSDGRTRDNRKQEGASLVYGLYFTFLFSSDIPIDLRWFVSSGTGCLSPLELWGNSTKS